MGRIFKITNFNVGGLFQRNIVDMFGFFSQDKPDIMVHRRKKPMMD